MGTDRLLKVERPGINVVYKIPCEGETNGECGTAYVRTTKQFLKNRDVRYKSYLKNNNGPKKALAHHYLNEKDHF